MRSLLPYRYAMNNPCGGLKLSSFSYVKMEMQNILTLQKINFDLQVKSGQLMLNDHTGTRLFIRTAQKQSGHQQWANAVENFLLCPSRLPPLWLWSTVPKNVSTPNRMERHQSTEEHSTAGGRKGVCMQPTAAVPMVPLRDLGQTKAPLWASLSLYLLLEPCECLTGRRVPRSPNNTSCHPENLLFHSALLVACGWSREQEASGWRVDAHSNTGGRHVHGRMAKPDAELHFNTLEVPLVELLNTHHDN